MNNNILGKAVQAYINSHLNADVSKIVLSKSPFPEVSSAELANQIAAKKKAEKKLPTWFNTKEVYYPTMLSIEQTSSEDTAKYKSNLAKGKRLIDITAGFGVDSYYFSKKWKRFIVVKSTKNSRPFLRITLNYWTQNLFNVSP